MKISLSLDFQMQIFDFGVFLFQNFSFVVIFADRTRPRSIKDRISDSGSDGRSSNLRGGTTMIAKRFNLAIFSCHFFRLRCSASSRTPREPWRQRVGRLRYAFPAFPLPAFRVSAFPVFPYSPVSVFPCLYFRISCIPRVSVFPAFPVFPESRQRSNATEGVP